MPLNIKLAEQPENHEEKTESQDRLIRNITFFGDSAIAEDSPIYKSVWEAAKLLAQNNFKIVNGGGPGIMKAATDGAESVNGNTIAVYWQPKLASFFEGKNLANVTDESETCSNYMVRTLGLIEKGDAYVVCKGGTGTISELGMVWALAKLYYGCHKPVILYGSFWEPIMHAIQENMNIDEIELGVLYHATTPQEIVDIINEHEQKIQHCREKSYTGDESIFLLRPEIKMTMLEHNRSASSYHSRHAGKLVSQEQLEEFSSMVNPPAKVLDVGTGPGYDLKFLAEKYSASGIEISRKFSEIARYENPGVEIINDDVITYDIGKEKYKGIWARNSLHHIPEEHLEGLFAKLADALVEGGILYIIVREGHGEIIEEDKSFDKTKKFYHLFSKQELMERATKAGLKVERVDEQQRSHNWIIGVFRK